MKKAIINLLAIIITLTNAANEPVEVIDIEPAEEIIEAAEERPDKEWVALVSATWRYETGNGKSRLWTKWNNAGGIKCGSEYCTYDSKESGMEALENLLQGYVEKYGYDFRAIRERYCQCGPEDYDKFMQIYYEEYSAE